MQNYNSVDSTAAESVRAWRERQIGLFIHFGVYSVFGGVYEGRKITEGYSEQIMQFAPIPKEAYLAAANTMDFAGFSAKEYVSLARRAEMNYILITAKHHDGFCMFDTKTTDFNIVKQTPYAKDLLAELSRECRTQGMGFGIYFSLVDWNLGHSYDPNNRNPIPKEIELPLCEQLKELVTGYGELCEIWFDMSTPTPEQSETFRGIVKQYCPSAMINGRIGNGKGDFITFWDNEIPTEAPDHPWQTPQSIYPDTWGYRSWRVHEDIETRSKRIIENYESVCSRGGNYLLNIGPKGDGSVDEFEREVLIRLGEHIRKKRH